MHEEEFDMLKVLDECCCGGGYPYCYPCLIPCYLPLCCYPCCQGVCSKKNSDDKKDKRSYSVGYGGYAPRANAGPVAPSPYVPRVNYPQQYGFVQGVQTPQQYAYVQQVSTVQPVAYSQPVGYFLQRAMTPQPSLVSQVRPLTPQPNFAVQNSYTPMLGRPSSPYMSRAFRSETPAVAYGY